MISKEVLRDANYLADSEVDEFTVGMYAASWCLALRDMNLYCFEENFKRCHVEES